MNEKIIFLEHSLQKINEEQSDIQKINVNNQMSLSESQIRIKTLEKNERNLLAKLQAREAEIDASHQIRLKLKNAIDSEADAKMKQKSLAAENNKLQSRLNGAFERIKMLEEKLSAPTKIWKILNISWAVFFIFLGVTNYVIYKHFSITVWTYFKFFGTLGLIIVFTVIQSIFLGKYIKEPTEIQREPESETSNE